MYFKIVLLFCITLTTQIITSESAKILALFTSHRKSHLIIYTAVTQALLERGHNLTIVTTLDLDDSDSRYNHIKVPGHDFQKVMADLVKMSTYERMINIFGIVYKMVDHSRVALESPEIKNLMNEESFDLVILGYFFNEYEIGLAAHFKCPTILIWMIPPFHGLNQLIGNPNEISHVPNPMWGINTSTKFFDRVLNTLLNVVDHVMWWILRRTYNNFYLELFPPEKYPPYEKVLKNISLVLCNYHFSQGLIRANVPALVEIGGIQIEENPEPLPKDVNQHLDSATKDGAILFSLGSYLHSADFDSNTTTIIYKVLSTLKQKVIWKWESNKIPGTSKNILYRKWVPQNSILAHPNMKLFITHGGRGSVVESEYFGIPMIGLPLMGDQLANIDEVVNKGYGLSLDHKSLTEEKLRNAINEIIRNPKYRENTKHYRDLFLDRPMTPKETAIYWIEYVLRHGGAKHMQSPAVNMPFYQLIGLDVMTFIGVILYLWLKITNCICKFLWKRLRSLCSRNHNKNLVVYKKKN